MSVQPKLSLIVATFGRTTELALLLESLCCQTVGTELFELIIVDQNTDGRLDELLRSYQARLSILHIYSKVRGLSVCRNLGLEKAKGLYCCVPDDDCTYYPDTIAAVLHELEQNKNPDMLIGKVFDRKRGVHVFKRTPEVSCRVHLGNFHSLVSSITLFFKNDGSRFDESFGVGATYPSNEDADLILGFLKAGKTVVYTPSVACNHPPYDARTMSEEKLFLYGIGFGAVCRKHFSGTIAFLYVKVLVFQCLMILKGALTGQFTELRRRRQALRGRWKGFFMYTSQNY